MGKYTGAWTANALAKAREFVVDFDLEEALATELAETKAYLAAPETARPPNFTIAAHRCEAAAHGACRSIADIDGIDWRLWRLGTELRLLRWRVDASTPLAGSRMSWVEASSLLHLAIALTLTERASVALPIFELLAAKIKEPLDKMALRRGKPRDWGPIAFVLQDALPMEALPGVLRIAPPSDLEAAQLARVTYCDARDPHGSLLGHIDADLVPLELILWARRHGHPDPVLAQLDAGISATAYPENEIFQEIDIELSVAGL